MCTTLASARGETWDGRRRRWVFGIAAHVPGARPSGDSSVVHMQRYHTIARHGIAYGRYVGTRRYAVPHGPPSCKRSIWENTLQIMALKSADRNVAAVLCVSVVCGEPGVLNSRKLLERALSNSTLLY